LMRFRLRPEPRYRGSGQPERFSSMIMLGEASTDETALISDLNDLI